MNEKQKKVLTLSLLAYTLGGFMFAVGLMLKTTVTLIAFYFIGLALIICGMLCLYNNYKLERTTKLYLFLTYIGLLLVVFLSFALFSQL